MSILSLRRRLAGVPLTALVSALLLSGCATVRPSGNVVSERPAAVSVDGQSDWAWDISGDAIVRPGQVFSIKGKTYLQMKAGQRIPAVFVNGEPIPFTIAPPYIVVNGVSQKYDLMADGYRALVVHRGPVVMPAAPRVIHSERIHRVSQPTAAGGNVGDDPDLSTVRGFVEAAKPTPTRTVAQPQTDVKHALAAADRVATTDAVAASPLGTPVRVWRITPDQQLLSLALAEWGRAAGASVVWKADVDLPIRGTAEYRTPKFFAAMSELLAAASTPEYRFFVSVTGNNTVTVISVKES